MDQFRFGLQSDVKDLVLTFLEDFKSLTEAISRAVRDVTTGYLNDDQNANNY
jgi:hypothetical protein